MKVYEAEAIPEREATARRGHLWLKRDHLQSDGGRVAGIGPKGGRSGAS